LQGRVVKVTEGKTPGSKRKEGLRASAAGIDLGDVRGRNHFGSPGVGGEHLMTSAPTRKGNVKGGKKRPPVQENYRNKKHGVVIKEPQFIMKEKRGTRVSSQAKKSKEKISPRRRHS